MVRVYIRHLVKDYGPWRAAYDAFDEERRGMGSPDMPCIDTSTMPTTRRSRHEFDSREAADAFTGSDRLREVMHEAGVEGAPTIWYTAPA